jgi:diguanylate cyclase (GGDEF)-like protein
VSNTETSSPAPARGLRRRLVASILFAALLPFAAAFWIANSYVSDQQHNTVETRVAFTLRSAVAEYGDVLESTRVRAHTLASNARVVRAMGNGDVSALRNLLRTRESVVLASGRRVQKEVRGAPVARVDVRDPSGKLGTVEVAAPPLSRLLARIQEGAPIVQGDLLAISRANTIVVGPAATRGTATKEGHVKLATGRYTEASAALPGYTPEGRLVAFASEAAAESAISRLRWWLVFVGLTSLASIFLYAAALARPLVRGVDKVADVAQQAEIDPLTQVANRRGFERVLATELTRGARYGHPCSLVLADLDDFKRVNDEHGHDAGDAVLVSFAARLRDSVRASDIVARLGGEEFALILPELDLDGAILVAERVREALANDRIVVGESDQLHVTASFGVAESSADDEHDWTQLMRHADQALYAAKRAGKNRVTAQVRGIPNRRRPPAAPATSAS